MPYEERLNLAVAITLSGERCIRPASRTALTIALTIQGGFRRIEADAGDEKANEFAIVCVVGDAI